MLTDVKFEPTPVPSADFCRPDEYLPAVACLEDQVAVWYMPDPDNETKIDHGAYACPKTLDGSLKVEEGWWPPPGATTGQWLAYQLHREIPVGRVCVRWGEHHITNDDSGSRETLGAARRHETQDATREARRGEIPWPQESRALRRGRTAKNATERYHRRYFFGARVMQDHAFQLEFGCLDLGIN